MAGDASKYYKISSNTRLDYSLIGIIGLLNLLTLACEKKNDPEESFLNNFAQSLELGDEQKPSQKKNELGKMEAVVSSTKVSISHIKDRLIYFYSVGPKAGNLGGRAGANQFCRSQLDHLTTDDTVLAFLSVSEVDQTHFFAAQYHIPQDTPVASLVSDKIIADDWPSLFSDLNSGIPPRLKITLEKAEVLSEGDNRLDHYEGLFWSGTSFDSQGAKDGLAEHHCQNWSSKEGWGSVGGNHGVVHPKYLNRAVEAYAYPWYDYHMIMPCRTELFLLCLVFRTPGRGEKTQPAPLKIPENPSTELDP